MMENWRVQDWKKVGKLYKYYVFILNRNSECCLILLATALLKTSLCALDMWWKLIYCVNIESGIKIFWSVHAELTPFQRNEMDEQEAIVYAEQKLASWNMIFYGAVPFWATILGTFFP